ncbi:hypothetical protein [Rhodococcus sp. NPDC047139]|uniref:serine hydrolase n=1 Tax=Rhodococcus sp. NPDC047139 TaxID=3155141 RepID=UPI0033DF6AF4
MKCRRGRARSGAMMLFIATALLVSACDSVESHPLTRDALALGSVADSDAGEASTTSLSMDDLPRRIDAAVALAERRGARLTVGVLDRESGTRMLGGANEPFETASTVKLFIAEEVLRQEALGESALSDDDHDLIRSMLRSSDDYAATSLWEAYGGPEIIERVVERHALTGTAPPDPDAWWWNTITTASDLLSWYDDLLDDTGEEAGARIVGHLMEYTDDGLDGYDQRFGLPAGLDDPVELGVKQGWMCCLSGEWLHLSSGFFGEDHRYVVVVVAREAVTYDASDPLYETGFLPDTALYDATTDGSAQHARETMTMAVETFLGSGHQR